MMHQPPSGGFLVGQFPIFKNTYLCYDLGVDFPHFIKIVTKDCDMKKKLLILLIAVIPMLMPNLASAVAIEMGETYSEYIDKCTELAVPVELTNCN